MSAKKKATSIAAEIARFIPKEWEKPPALEELEKALRALDVAKVNISHLAGLLQGALSAVLKECRVRRFKRKPWDRRGPGTSGITISGGYLDHISRHVNKETKEVVYRSEPYQLCGNDIVELAALVERGWSVVIHGDSPYYPGWTVAIDMERPKDGRKTTNG